MQSDLDVLPSISKIAVAFDESQCALLACDFAGKIARGLKAQMTAIYVYPPSIAVRPTRVPDEKLPASLAKAMPIAEAYEESARRLKSDPRLLSVYETLLDYSSREKRDLLVSGTRGAFRI